MSSSRAGVPNIITWARVVLGARCGESRSPVLSPALEGEGSRKFHVTGSAVQTSVYEMQTSAEPLSLCEAVSVLSGELRTRAAKCEQ